MKTKNMLGIVMILLGFCQIARSQSMEFTYQGSLKSRLQNSDFDIYQQISTSPEIKTFDSRTVCNSGTPDFATMALAIADANAAVPAGGRTYLVCAGHTETAPPGGFEITASNANAANPVVFVKDGIGTNPTFTAPTPQATGVLSDAIFKIIGADNITIDGFTMLENPANTDIFSAANDMTEFGVALFYATVTDGCQNITLTNNSIDLERTYQNSYGIYSNSTHSSTVMTISATATGISGGNHNLKITRNSITDVNNGIVVVGPTAAADHNNGLIIGGSLTDSNVLTNYGRTQVFPVVHVNLGTIGVSGIWLRNTNNYDVSFNNITGSGNVVSGQLHGIQVNSASVQPVGTFINSISDNAIAVSSNFNVPINGITVAATTSSPTSTTNINGNNFTALSHLNPSSNAITGISHGGSAVAGPLVVNISNNTFTNITTSGTGSFTFISNGFATPPNGTKNVNNNSIITAFNKTGSGGFLTLLFDNGSDSTGSISNSNNNNFSNITVAGATIVSGWVSTNNATTKNVSGNFFSNWTGGTGSLTGMSIESGGTTTFQNNNVSNFSNGAAITGISIGNFGTLINARQNSVHSFSSSGAAAVSGISISVGASFSTRNIFRNKIYNLEANNAAGTVNGMLIPNSSSTINVFNNLIGDLRAPAATSAAIPPLDAIRGINLATATHTSTSVNISFNTIFINASSTGANFSTAGIFHAASAAASVSVLSLRNNIIVNTSSPAGTGVTAALRRSGASLANFGIATNNNLFFAGTPSGARLIYFDGTNVDQTLAAYKSRVAPRESHSATENPTFISTSGGSADFLHLNPAVPTQCEGGGINIAGITEDFDGVIRQGNPGYLGTGLVPDIGADEGEFQTIDLLPPFISFQPLPNSSSSPTRDFANVSITDASGVNIMAGTKPRVYFKRSTDANTFADNSSSTNGWKFSEANGTLSPFNFTIDYSLLSGGTGASPGNVLQYFVVAQDLTPTPQVGITSGIFNALPSSVDLTSAAFPIGGAINTYTVLTGFAGSYDVGAGQAFTSLTNTGGIFGAINAGILTGNVTINITSDLLGETSSVLLNQWAEEGIGNYTVLIKPAGAARTITSTTTAASVIRLNGADRVTIDGSLNGGTDRSLTIVNPRITGSPTSGPGVIIIGSLGAGAGANDITIKNCNIQAGSIGSAAVFNVGIFVGNTSGALNGPDNDNLTIQNNVISRARTGIQTSGDAAGRNDNTMIVDNIFGDDISADSIGRIGLTISESNNAMVARNTVRNIFVSGDDAAAIGIVASTMTNSTISENLVDTVRADSSFGPGGIALSTGVIGTTVTRNNVTNIDYIGTGGNGGKGISINTGNFASNILVANNFVSDIKGDGSSEALIANVIRGISVLGNTGGITICNNSVNLGSGAFAGHPSGTFSAAFFAASATSNLNICNNIFASNLDNTNSVLDKTYAAATDAFTNSMFATIRNNNYFIIPDSGSTGGFVGILNGIDRPTLIDWQTATGQDTGSFSVDPLFLSTTDLHLQPFSQMINSGFTISAITNDFDGHFRPQGAGYDIGADEILAPTASNVKLAGRVMTAGGQGIVNVNVSVIGGNLAEPLHITTGSFGYFLFDGLRAGDTYIVAVKSRRFTFAVPARAITLQDDVVGFNFLADAQ